MLEEQLIFKDIQDIIIDRIRIGSSEKTYFRLAAILGQPLFFIIWVFDMIKPKLTHTQRRNLYYGTGLHCLIMGIIFFILDNIIHRYTDIHIYIDDNGLYILNKIWKGYFSVLVSYIVIGYNNYHMMRIIAESSCRCH